MNRICHGRTDTACMICGHTVHTSDVNGSSRDDTGLQQSDRITKRRIACVERESLLVGAYQEPFSQCHGPRYHALAKKAQKRCQEP